ncbi:MAG TPA: ATP-binding protein [Povalibacter sp.]|nr:ATP-binding protein [Povalibacter sp.]
MDASLFMPHGHCYLWEPGVLWLNVIPDVLIALAYLAIPFVLLHVARRRPDLPFNWLFVWFGIFIAACGLTHVMEVWNVWHAHYWAQGIVKLVTAAASIPAAWLLWKSLPAILRLPSPIQMQQTNDALARANSELEAFTASVSHDLRSPLSSIAGQAGLLELSVGEQATEEQKRRLHRIQGSVKQMSELIEALLTLSRISRQSLQSESVDLSTLAQDVAAELRQQDPVRTVEVVVQPGMQVRGDRRLLRTVLANLLGNAWKFTSRTAAPRIEVGMDSGSAAATLHVRDNGAGFDMAYQERLFKPFQRLHAATDFPGSGIGLATVQRIVERHGGRVWAEGRPDEGAVFYCSLPRG